MILSGRSIIAPLAAGLAATLLLIGAGCTEPGGDAPERLSFSDVTPGSGLPLTGKTSGAVLADLDGDGRLDLVIGRHDGVPEAYLNNGDMTFDHVPDWGSSSDIFDHHATLVDDLDGDGAVDFYLVAGAHRGAGQGPNSLILSSSDVDAAPEYGITDPFGRGRGALSLDVDRDGVEELLVLNFKTAMRAFALTPPWPARDEVRALFGIPPADDRALSAASPRERRRFDSSYMLLPWNLEGDPRPEFLALGGVTTMRILRWRDGGLRFAASALEPAHYIPPPAAATWIDGASENDSYLALVYGADDREIAGGGRRRNRLLSWVDGRFEELRGAMPGDAGKGVAIQAGDLDLDGKPDLIIQQSHRGANETRHRVLLASREGEYRAVDGLGDLTAPAYLGSGDGLIVFDLDGDGDLDILSLLGGVTGDAVGGGIRLFENGLDSGTWIKIRLEGNDAGPVDGAVVEVVSGSTVQRRQVWPRQVQGSSFRAPVHLGLDGAAVIDRIGVLWPDGGIAELIGIGADSLVVVEQGE